MRTRALILFFPFALFIAETVSFPTHANTDCKKMTCSKMMKQMSCSHKKDNSEKPSNKCNNTAACSICPVCSIFVFQPQHTWFIKYTLLKNNYPLSNGGSLSSYISKVWKPPNKLFI